MVHKKPICFIYKFKNCGVLTIPILNRLNDSISKSLQDVLGKRLAFDKLEYYFKIYEK